MGRISYWMIAILLMLAVNSEAASVVGSPKFTTYSTNRQAEINNKVDKTTTVNGQALSGNVTVTTITGNAGTATALAANGTNCSAGQAAIGVDASGNSEGCWTPAGAYTLPTATSTVLGGVKPDGTSILNTSGAISVANPLNQNTTGSAATLTTGRTISISGPITYTSPSFDGSSNVTATSSISAQTGTGTTFVMNTTPTINAGPERVTNGGFDSATTGWTIDTGTLASVSGGVSGNCLQVTSTGSANYVNQNTITTTIGHWYKATLWVKSGTAGNIGFSLSTDGGNPGLSLSGTSSAAWTQYSVIFQDAAGYVSLYIGKNAGSGTMLFDSVSIAELPLFVNGDVYTTANIRTLVVPIFTNNANAIAGGLRAGQLYRSGGDPDAVYIVH